MADVLSQAQNLDAALAAFLRDSLRQPWGWGGLGGVDCTSFVADWVARVTGYDPAAPYRGSYASGEECHALIKRQGGFLPLIAARMDGRFARTQSPRLGDVGLIEVPVRMDLGMPVMGTIAGIRGDGLWHARSLRGLVGQDWPARAAWRIGTR